MNTLFPLPCKGADAPEAGASALSYSYNTISFQVFVSGLYGTWFFRDVL